jgi:LysR family hydrogen peroxide-inducible transcriptional activator
MELQQLRYFVAIAETGSFTRAAERCQVAQPSLSQQIQKLERQLRQRLFDRLGRRVLLTEAGAALLERAAPILAAVDEAERSLRDGLDPGRGRLTVGAIPTVAPYLLPPVLTAFLRRYPQVETLLQEDVTQALLAALAAGELDLAVVALPVADERLRVEPLCTEALLVTLPRGHRLARRHRVGLDDLRDERFILLNEMHCLTGQVRSYCGKHGFTPQVACRSAQVATVQRLIELGLGVSLLPALARDADRSRKRVYREVAADEPPARTLAAVWHKQRYQSPTMRLFLEQLRSRALAVGGAG